MAGGEKLAQMIDEQAAGIAKSLGMPRVQTTTVDKELKKNSSKKKFNTRVFAILDDISAQEYSEFINEVLRTGTTQIIREDQSWTKDGELIRVVDFLEAE